MFSAECGLKRLNKIIITLSSVVRKRNNLRNNDAMIDGMPHYAQASDKVGKSTSQNIFQTA